MSAEKPNVVIIMVDEQKTNSLPLCGNPVVRAPNLKRLAQEGDPWELYNLYGQEKFQDIVAELRSLILDWTIETEDCLPPAEGDVVDG